MLVGGTQLCRERSVWEQTMCESTFDCRSSMLISHTDIYTVLNSRSSHPSHLKSSQLRDARIKTSSLHWQAEDTTLSALCSSLLVGLAISRLLNLTYAASAIDKTHPVMPLQVAYIAISTPSAEAAQTLMELSASRALEFTNRGWGGYLALTPRRLTLKLAASLANNLLRCWRSQRCTLGSGVSSLF